MAQLKVSKDEKRFSLKLSKAELTALYDGLSMDSDRYNDGAQYKLAMEVDDLLADYA